MSVRVGTRALRPLAVAAASFTVAALLTVAALALGGHDVGQALSAWASGAFGSVDRFTSITLVRATPLILAGLAVGFAFRAGVWNIGAEGQLYAGAILVTWVGLRVPEAVPGWAAVPLLVGLAALAGAAWALLPAVLRVRRGVNEVITTLLMNFVAIHIASALVRGPMQESRGVFPQSDGIAEAARLPALLPGSRLHAGFLIGVATAGLLAVVLARTRFGFQVRATGASPSAAEVSGRIQVGRVLLVTLLVSGAIAGVAGGAEVMGVTYALYENLSPGYGYTAIAVALLGGLHPVGVAVAGILFGALEAGGAQMQRTAGVPAVWVSAMEALAILSWIALDRLTRRRGWAA